MKKNRFHWETKPVALNDNCVYSTKSRFTILTSQLIRLEYSESNIFEDRASQSVFYRDFPRVEYLTNRCDGWLVIETKDLILKYQEGTEFSSETLQIKLKNEPASTWCFGDDFEDLGGTCQTLDCVDGAIPLERGVCSRNGFSILDDSNTLLLGVDDWVEVRLTNTKDMYFFGYGYDYIKAVQDLYRLTGIPPMLPAYALGNWWSRYYPYKQEEYLELMDRFKEKDIPFTVGVVDMDWHLVKIPIEYHDENDPLESNGWTGYTWNKELFPDYKQFLKELEKRNIKTALNLHPHAGVRRFDDMYEEMAKACGVDPSTGKRIPFDILSPEFMSNYFDILHHPYEEDGVNFWWMDWQQGQSYDWIHEANQDGKMQNERESLNPLWMLNHLHIIDISRDGKRPMFFSRYCGPGSHRYPVGFSGDTIITWESLKFQPYFTATASNIGYCWWSHDIGGHMRGYRDDELTTRWIQLGVFSPINRLHSGCDSFIQKEPWSYSNETEMIIEKWLRLRHELFPYIYTMNYRTHNELLPLIQPMYYSHPKCSGAYEVPEQFWFGSELIVAPITERNSQTSQLGKADAWLPQGSWFDFFDGTHYASKRGRKISLHRSIDSYPVLAKAGAIVPMEERKSGENRLGNCANMNVIVFPGADNTFVLYEDEGEYQNFETGAYVETKLSLQWGQNPCFTIGNAQGDLSLIPEKRTWTITFRGFDKNIVTHVFVDGKEYEVCGNVVEVTAPVTSEIQTKISGDTIIQEKNDIKDKCLKIMQQAQIDFETKNKIWNVIKDENKSLHQRLYQLSGSAPEVRPVIEAVKEQLCLVEDEYRGSEL